MSLLILNIMKIKIFSLFKGTVEFPINKFRINGSDIKSINFVTNNKKYEIKLFKYYETKNMYKIYTITNKDKFNEEIISDFSYGNSLIILSSCDGILEFGYGDFNHEPNIIQNQIDIIKEKAYERFYSIENNNNKQYLVIDEKIFKNYAYYSYDNELFNLLNLYSKCTTTNTNKFEIYRTHDIILGFYIDSSVDTLCKIYWNETLLFSFDIKKGYHYYQCLLIIRILQFNSYIMKFDDYVNKIEANGIYTCDKLQKLLSANNNIVMKYENGTIIKYSPTGWGTICIS